MNPLEARRRAISKAIGTTADDFDADVLQSIADGPIMAAGFIYLPAGRLSVDEYREREARILAGRPA